MHATTFIVLLPLPFSVLLFRLTNFLFHYVFYGGTEIKDTDTDTDKMI